MKQLPSNVSAYKRTPEFTESSIPKGLLHDHKTKEGVWAKIVILKGRLSYTIQEPEIETIELSDGLAGTLVGIVEPTIMHRIKPLGLVVFYVEFYR